MILLWDDSLDDASPTMEIIIMFSTNILINSKHHFISAVFKYLILKFLKSLMIEFL